METMKVSHSGRADSASGEVSLEEAVARAAQVLREGGVVMHATETCYGFAADIFNRAALKKVYELKQMALDKPLSIMVRSFEEAEQYGDFNEGTSVPGNTKAQQAQHFDKSVAAYPGDLAYRLAERFWPGPLTLVIPRKDAAAQQRGVFLSGNGLPPFLNAGAATVGIRVPDFPLVQKLLEAFGGPLCTTSANISGLPQVYRVEDYMDQVNATDRAVSWPDGIIDSGDIPFQLPSTVVEIVPTSGTVHNESGITFLRKGPVKNEVEKFLNNL